MFLVRLVALRSRLVVALFGHLAAADWYFARSGLNGGALHGDGCTPGSHLPG